MRFFRVAFVLALASPWAAAQQSPSYRVEGGSLNAGGRPSGGITASSASFHISLDSIGEAVVAPTALSNASLRVDGGLAPGYLPPREIRDLRFTDPSVLVWTGDRAAGTFRLYRDLISSLSSLGYGTCLVSGLTSPTATDTATPLPGSGFFYLATVANRLGEEGPKGAASDGTPRLGSPCP